MKVNILGVKIDNVTMQEAVERVEKMLRDGRKHQIVTPNPEFVMLAQKDEEFREILNEADLAISDGVGIVWASRILKAGARQKAEVLKERVTGTDLMIKLCKLAAKKRYSVFLLGGKNGVGERVGERLREKFKIKNEKLKIVGIFEGKPEDEETVLQIANCKSQIDFLFVAFGAPAQEKWIARNLPKLPVKVTMGVGGTFDFIVGKQKRAPKVFQKLGLEWLWRLVCEPWRWKRQLAIPKFMLAVVRQKFRWYNGKRKVQSAKCKAKT